MGAGKVDSKNLWRREQERMRRVRWRTLQRAGTSALVSIFGYAVHPGGPWFGYQWQDLMTAPCSHCGRTGVFTESSWEHECPGSYDGHRLPCAEGIPHHLKAHPCDGVPSMSYAGDRGPSLWRAKDWKEL